MKHFKIYLFSLLVLYAALTFVFACSMASLTMQHTTIEGTSLQ
jgi:hypothetical protein